MKIIDIGNKQKKIEPHVLADALGAEVFEHMDSLRCNACLSPFMVFYNGLRNEMTWCPFCGKVIQ